MTFQEESERLRDDTAPNRGSACQETVPGRMARTTDDYRKERTIFMTERMFLRADEVAEILLALTPEDFDFEKKTLRINKSYQRLRGKDVITTPKTDAGVRVIAIPDFLCEEMKDCLKLYYDIQSSDRIFPMTKYGLCRNMESGSKAAGVKRIRIHDLRHYVECF